MLAGVLGLWGLSLVVRGAWGERRGGRGRCPACGRDAARDARQCEGCGYRGRRGRALRSSGRSWWMVIGGVVVAALAPASFLLGLSIRREAYTGGETDSLAALGPWAMLAVGIVAFGLATVVRGVYGRSPQGKARCSRCWYDMSGAPGLVCPECGHDCGKAGNLYRRRRRPVVVWLGAMIVALGVASFTIPVLLSGGWQAFVPTAVMISGFEQLPDSAIGTGPGGRFVRSDKTLRDRWWRGTLSPAEQQRVIAKCSDILRTSSDKALLGRASEFLWDRDELADAIAMRLLDAVIGPPGPHRDAELAAVTNFLAMTPRAPLAPTRAAITAATDRLLAIVGSDTPAAANIATRLLGWSTRGPARLAAQLVESIDRKDSTGCNAKLSALIHLARAHQEVRDYLVPMMSSTSRVERVIAFIALYGEHGPWFWNSVLLLRAESEPLSDEGEDVWTHFGLLSRSLGSIWDWSSTGGLVFPSGAAAPTPAVVRTFLSDVIGDYLPVLVQGLGSGDAATRLKAVSYMAWLAYQKDLDLGPALPGLTRLADDPDPQIGNAAKEAIRVMGQK